MAVLSVSAFSATAGNLDIGAVVQGLLQHNRFELTRRSELIHLPGAPLRTIPGYVLARIPNVASWFTKTWSGLRFAREQAWRRASGRYAEERLRVIAHLVAQAVDALRSFSIGDGAPLRSLWWRPRYAA